MMKLTIGVLLASFSFSIASQVGAETPLEKTNQIITNAKQSCVSSGGQFSTNEDALQVYDFKTSDGAEELVVVDEYGFECSLAASYYQGSAGAVVHLITPNDYKYGYARGVEVTTMADGIPVVLMFLHGVSCDAVGYYPCVQAITVFDGELLSTK